jgi:hypothetical protein
MALAKARFFIVGIPLLLNLAIFVVELPEAGLATPTQPSLPPSAGLTPFY